MTLTLRRLPAKSSYSSSWCDGNFSVGLVHIISNAEEREAWNLLISFKVHFVIVMWLQENLAIFTLVLLPLLSYLLFVVVLTTYTLAYGCVSRNEGSRVSNPIFLIRILIVWWGRHLQVCVCKIFVLGYDLLCLVNSISGQHGCDCTVFWQVGELLLRRVITFPIAVIILTQFFVFMLKILVSTIRINYVKLATLRITLVYCWHFDL